MITVAGLGPGGLARTPDRVRSLVTNPDVTVIARTSDHPAAAELSQLRHVEFCDDLYQTESTFEAVYRSIADRVMAKAESGDVVYLVPGSPYLGELVVTLLRESHLDLTLIPAESFLDAVLEVVGYDPLERGLQILNAHDLGDPLVLDKPTIIAQVDRPEILADVAARIDALTDETSIVVVLSDLGTEFQLVDSFPAGQIPAERAGTRTSLFVDPVPGGLIGAVQTMRLLRVDCPWDRDQTHQSLVKNLVEEVYELIEVIGRLDDDPADLAASAAVEDELGDVLLQVLFHEAIGRESGLFDIDSIAEGLREKLVRRHPHVFSDVEVGSAEEVKANWDRIKAEETGAVGDSALDGVPSGMPSLQRAAKVQNRAAKVGFDWSDAAGVIQKIREETSELEAALGDSHGVHHEIGDLMFSVVNVTRHLGVDPELALRNATARFEARFRRMEEEGPLNGLTLEELDRRWERAKGRSG